jgi:hypothetical protein
MQGLQGQGTKAANMQVLRKRVRFKINYVTLAGEKKSENPV